MKQCRQIARRARQGIVTLAAWAAVAACSAPGAAAPWEDVSSTAPWPEFDVALRPNGTLVGRVIARDGVAGPTGVAGLPVTLFRGSMPVAAARTDAQGRFAVRGARGGLYRVVVDGSEGRSCRYCRVWTAAGAPPHAGDEIGVLIGGPLTRGQSPWSLVRTREGTVVVLAAGAIAAPVVYYAAKRDDYIPAAPASP